MTGMDPRPAFAAGIASLVVLAAGAASAQPTIVLAPHSEAELTEPDRNALMRAFDQALRAEGVQARQPSDACVGSDCQPAASGDAQADSVQLTVWRSTSGGISGVSVTVTRDGLRYSEGATVLEGDHDGVASAVQTATHGAYQRARRGPGPWLEVTGAPAGSEIVVDGQLVGAVPGRYRVAGGLHRVAVRARGFHPYDATVTVPRNPDGLRRLELELQPQVGPGAPADKADRSDESRSSPLNFAIAGAAVVLGTVLAIGPVRTLANDGECGSEAAGRCTGVVDFDGESALQLGAATVLVAGGAAFALWAPFRVRFYSDGAEARVAARF